jgi:hypothetical protein
MTNNVALRNLIRITESVENQPIPGNDFESYHRSCSAIAQPVPEKKSHTMVLPCMEFV